ncbi:hypothetical protein ACMYYO_09680 [Dermacoccaceae bacterium W4C1]
MSAKHAMVASVTLRTQQVNRLSSGFASLGGLRLCAVADEQFRGLLHIRLVMGRRVRAGASEHGEDLFHVDGAIER